MLAHGNGDPKVCANNLFQMSMYECPLVRDKGLDPSIIDHAGNAPFVMQDAQRLIKRFEPRIRYQDVGVREREDGTYQIQIEAVKV